MHKPFFFLLLFRMVFFFCFFVLMFLSATVAWITVGAAYSWGMHSSSNILAKLIRDFSRYLVFLFLFACLADCGPEDRIGNICQRYDSYEFISDQICTVLTYILHIVGQFGLTGFSLLLVFCYYFLLFFVDFSVAFFLFCFTCKRICNLFNMSIVFAFKWLVIALKMGRLIYEITIQNNVHLCYFYR